MKSILTSCSGFGQKAAPAAAAVRSEKWLSSSSSACVLPGGGGAAVAHLAHLLLERETGDQVIGTLVPWEGGVHEGKRADGAA